MPFRNKPLAIPRRIYAALLPAYVCICLGSIAAWLVWAVSIVKGGWQHVTPGEAFIFAGFAGIAVLIVFSTAVTIVIIESVLYDARVARNKEMMDFISQFSSVISKE